MTEFQAQNRGIHASVYKYPDEIVIVYFRTNGDYDVCVESEYHGLDENICGKYLNGHIAPI